MLKDGRTMIRNHVKVVVLIEGKSAEGSVTKDVEKMRIEDVGKTRIEDVGKTRIEDVGKTRIEDVGKTRIEALERNNRWKRAWNVSVLKSVTIMKYNQTTLLVQLQMRPDLTVST
jgi:hypothetical protein